MDKTFIISKKDNVPLVRLKNFRVKTDGTSDCDIQYDDVFLEMVKSKYKAEEVSKGQLSEYVNTLVEKATSGIEGYKMVIEEGNKV